MNQTATIELDEGERELLHDALDILSPDDPDASERLEALTQYVLDSTLEPGAVELTFEEADLELAIAALEIVQPDDFEAQELAECMEERFRAMHRDHGDMPAM